MKNWINEIKKEMDSFVNKYNIVPNAIIVGTEVVGDILTSPDFVHYTDRVSEICGLKVLYIDYHNRERIEVLLRKED